MLMKILWSLLMVAVSIAPVGAADIQLRDVCHVTDSVVRLGEIADIYDQNNEVAKRLARTELCPAPFIGQRRTLTHRQIRDHLSRAGWNLIDHQISGASKVVVHADERAGLATAALSGGRRISSVAKRSAHQQVENLLVAELHRQHGKRQQKVTFQLTQTQSRFVRDHQGNLRLPRSIPAGSGTHRVEIVSVRGSNSGERMTVDVRVEAPKAVVTTRRTLPKGKIITREDVELKYTDDKAAKRSAVTNIDEVLGLETTMRLAEGQTLLARHARKRILVRSGSVVTVYARSGGIQVRASAVARENGTHGDVILVEALKTRKKYSARVTDLDTVEVLAKGVTVGRG
jgi:flagella basal body P-ring formation protein FlgA